MANECHDPLNLPWFSPTRPATFDGGLKYYEQLLVLKRLIEELESMVLNGDIPGIQTQIDAIWAYVKSDAFVGPIQDWVCANLPCIVAQVCKWFWFGINDNGNVVCVIPTSWNNMSVTWNMDFGSADFGRPTIEWE